MKIFLIQFVCIFIAISIATLYLNSIKEKPKEVEIKGVENINIKLDGENNNLIFNNNETITDIMNLLPIEDTMTNNDNELSLELKEAIKSNPEKIEKASKGDVLLKDNKIIIILENKELNNEYTKIGKVLLVDKLDNLKEKEKVKVVMRKG